MKTRHRHRAGGQLFLILPVTASRRVIPCFMYMWTCHCSICKHSGVNVWGKRVENKKNRVIDWQKDIIWNGAWVCMCMWGAQMGMAGSPELSFADSASCGPSAKTVSWELGELKAPGPRVVQIHSLQWTPPVQFLNIILEPIKHASFP